MNLNIDFQKYEENKSGYNKTGIVFEIERFAIHDGPGIRTVVFLKGCPLLCKWCSNPESQKLIPKLVYWQKKCIKCEKCIHECDKDALKMYEGNVAIDYNKCNLCGKCVGVCNTEALVFWGHRIKAATVLNEILKDLPFYRRSNGGVTFSGGEPFYQPDFLNDLLLMCKRNNIHTCVDTSGYDRWEIIEKILKNIDLFLYDLKIMNDSSHIAFTGVSNKIILENFIKIAESKKEIIVRIPVIPGINDDSDNFEKLIIFLKKYAPSIGIGLLPYHNLAKSKYSCLKMEYELSELQIPSKQEMETIRDNLISEGFKAYIDI